MKKPFNLKKIKEASHNIRFPEECPKYSKDDDLNISERDKTHKLLIYDPVGVEQ